MLKLIGAFMLMIGAASLGFGAASRLRDRVTGLRALMAGLEQMERELSFRLTPMPELLGRLAQQAPAPADGFFLRCREGIKRLGERTMGQVWHDALEESGLLLSVEERQILYGLGEVLGRYDGDGQREALKTAVADLGRCLDRAEGERGRLGRVYGTLGLSAGAVLVILLL